MKGKKNRILALFLTLVMTITMIPGTLAFASDSTMMHVNITVNLPAGMTVPAGEIFTLSISGYEETLVGEIQENENSVVISGDIDVDHSPDLSYSIADDAGLNVVTDGWYSESGITHGGTDSKRFDSSYANTTQDLTFNLEEGVFITGDISKSAEITTQEALRVNLSYTDNNTHDHYRKDFIIPAGQNSVSHRIVILPTNDVSSYYYLKNYEGRDIVFADSLLSHMDASTGIVNESVTLQAGVEISGILSIPDNIPADHTGFQFVINAFNVDTNKGYTSSSNFYSNNSNYNLSPKARAMVYSIVVPKGNYKLEAGNISDNYTQSYADNNGGSTKIEADAEVFNVQASTEVDFVGLFAASANTEAAPTLATDVILEGNLVIPEDINESFSMRMSIDSSAYNDYTIYRSFNSPKAGSYGYCFVVPRALLETDRMVVKASFDASNTNGFLTGYMHEVYLKPGGGSTLLRNEGAISEAISGRQTLDFTMQKGTYVKIIPKIADGDSTFGEDMKVKAHLFDENGQMLSDNAWSVKILSNNRLAEEEAYLFIPESVTSFKIGANSYNNSVYDSETYLGELGTTSDINSAKTFTHQDIVNTNSYDLTLIRTEVKTVTGNVTLPSGYPGSHPEIPVRVVVEKADGVNAYDEIIIPQDATNANFELKVPAGSHTTFALSFQSDVEGIIQRQLYKADTASKTVLGYENASDIPMGDPQTGLDLGTIELIGGLSIDITFSNPQNIQEDWAQITAFDASTGDIIGDMGFTHDDLNQFPKQIAFNITEEKPFILGLYQFKNEETTYLKDDNGTYVQTLVKADAKVFNNLTETADIQMKLMPKSTQSPTVAVTGVALNKNTLSMDTNALGDLLIATVAPADASSKALVWTSSQPSVASVSNQGLVMPLSAGTTTITVKTVDGNFTATCVVTVSQASVVIPVTSVTISDTNDYLSTTSTNKTMTASVLPLNASDKTLAWTSSNLSVATIDGTTGALTLVGRGTTTITASAGGVSGTKLVTVRSSDTKLSGIIAGGNPIADFNADTSEYFIDNLTKDQEFTVSATANQANATVKVNEVANTKTQTLKVGVNVFNLEVTAEDGSKRTVKVLANVPIVIVPDTPVTIDDTTNKIIQIPTTIDNTQKLAIKIQKTIQDAELILGTPIDDNGKKVIDIAGALEFNVEETGKPNFKVEMPADIKVSSTDQWNGKINMPKVTQNVAQTTVSIGVPEMELTFDKPVRIVLPGMAGKNVKWTRGATSQEITKTLSADTAVAATAELIGGIREGKFTSGNDLIVWTTHFTDFTAYTPAPVSSGGGGGGSYVAPVITPTTPATTTPADKTPTPATQVTVKPTPFKDVIKHWAKDSITRLASKNVISGFADGSFMPDRKITRAEFLSILVRAFELKGTTDQKFEDTQKHWANSVIKIAIANKLVSGYQDGTFKPDAPITREEMAIIASKFLKDNKNVKAMSFKDQSTISSWAKDAIQLMTSQDVMGGYTDVTFRPKGNTTRAEAIVVIDKLMKLNDIE